MPPSPPPNPSGNVNFQMPPAGRGAANVRPNGGEDCGAINVRPAGGGGAINVQPGGRGGAITARR